MTSLQFTHHQEVMTTMMSLQLPHHQLAAMTMSPQSSHHQEAVLMDQAQHQLARLHLNLLALLVR